MLCYPAGDDCTGRISYWRRGGPADAGFNVRTADGSLSAHYEHTIAVTATGPQELAGHYATFQLYAAGGSTIYTDLETDPGGVATTTPHVAITPGTYWFSMEANYASGTANLNLYETTNYTLVDSITNAMATGSDLAWISFGNGESGTSTASTSFEDVMVNYTNPVFPLGP